MKKVIFSLISILTAVSIVSASAFALFSDTAELRGITFATGNADLLVGVNSNDLRETYPVLASDFQFLELAPGKNNIDNPQPMVLKNNSSSPIKLSVNGKLNNLFSQIPAGSFNLLKDVVKMAVVDSNNSLQPTDWHSLNDWVATEQVILTDANALNQGEIRNFNVYVMVDESASNNISGKTLANIKFDLIGTQVIE